MPVSTASNIAPQTEPLPRCKVENFSEVAAFDTYVTAAGSQNDDVKLVVKSDDNMTSTRRYAYLGFDLKKYTAPGLIDTAKLKIHVLSGAPAEFNVFIVRPDDFWHTSFSYADRPAGIGGLLATFKTSDKDDEGWITTTLRTASIADEIYGDGKISMMIERVERGGTVSEFSSTRGTHIPQLILGINAATLHASEGMRYLSVTALSTIRGDAHARISDLRVIDKKGVLVPRQSWRVIEATNETVGTEAMFDDNPSTSWGIFAPLPSYFVVDFGTSVDIAAITYLSRLSGVGGRIGDLLLYGSSNRQDWKLIGSRSMGGEHLPYIIFTGEHSNSPQIEINFDLPIKPLPSLEMARLKSNYAGWPGHITGLFSSASGVMAIWVDQVASTDIVALHPVTNSKFKEHRLTAGMNAISLDASESYYVSVRSNDSSDIHRTANIRLMGNHIKRKPSFISASTSQADWLQMLATYHEATSIELQTTYLNLGVRRSDYSPFIETVQMQELADAYDQTFIPVLRAAGMREGSTIHRPCANRFLMLPVDTGQMSTAGGIINYKSTLTFRMVQPDEVRAFGGIWHEVGHNLQARGLDWPNQGEVVCNLFSFAAAAARMTAIELATAYESATQTAYGELATVQSYSALSRTSREMMFHHLYYLFAERTWYLFHRRYRDNLHGIVQDPEFTLQPEDDADKKMNLMAVMASIITNKDLIEFFDFWKFPLTAQTLSTIRNLNLPVLDRSQFDRLPTAIVHGRGDAAFDMNF